MASFLGEIKRRKVFQVAAVYAVVAWLLVQIVATVEAPLSLPIWFDTLVIVLLALGFPVALVFAWAFELSPDGIVRDEGQVLHRGRAMEYVLIGLLVVALGFVVLDSYVLPSSDPYAGLVDVTEPVPGFSNRAAIAVLPFANLSGDASEDYLSDGITEQIVSGLYAIGSFPVIASRSTFAYKGDPKDVREVTVELGAGYVVEGSIQRNEDRIRATAQLNDAAGRQLWSDRFDTEFRDLFSMQDEITQQIIGAIEPELLQSEIQRVSHVRTEDMEAFDFYLQAAANATAVGAAFADRNGRAVTVERIEQAIDLIQKAIDIDSNFADAYTMKGHILSAYARLLPREVGPERAAETLTEAMAAVQEGYERDPYGAATCSCYVAFLGWVGPKESRNIELALRIQEEARKQNPSSALVHAILAQVYQLRERYEEGIEEIHLAQRLSPRDVDFSFFLAVEAAIEMSRGNWARGADIAQHSIALRDLNHHSHAVRIASLYANNRHDEAASAVADLYESVPGFSVEMLYDVSLPKSLKPVVASIPGAETIDDYRDGVAAIINALCARPVQPDRASACGRLLPFAEGRIAEN